MQVFLQTFIGGVSLGAIYALVAAIWLVPDKRIERFVRD